MKNFIALVCLFVGCGGDDLGRESNALTLFPAPNSSQELHILPSDTSLPPFGMIGAGGDVWHSNNEHYAYRNPVGALCQQPCTTYKLVVFLPGCGGKPENSQSFMQVARDQGYHVIGLDYPNPCGLNDACGSSLSCPGNNRDEVAFGDLSNNDVPLEGHVQDAISKRLKALLLELMDRDPFGQWGNFLVDDNSMPEGVRPNYDLIVMAGHSLGAGYAGYIAKHKTVRRVVMMANPADAVNHPGMPNDPSPTPTNWLTTPLASQTPSGRYWGLIHTNDLIGNRFNKTMASWTALGLSAAHRFTASAYCTTVHDQHTAHNSVAHCPTQYAPTWQTMLGTP